MEEQEYRVPIKILTQRDPIIGGKLSLREMGQWCVAAVLIYLCLNVSPLPFQINLAGVATLFMVGIVFIHVPVNGLTGLEWIFINLRYRLEHRLHHALGVQAHPVERLNKPTFRLTLQTQAQAQAQQAHLQLPTLKPSGQAQREGEGQGQGSELESQASALELEAQNEVDEEI